MIIGSGLLASKFSKFKNLNFTIFASGVSNSSEIRISEFTKEENLLRENLSKEYQKPFVYFSSCDIQNPQLNKKPYYLHKLNMENIIKSSKKDYYIFRLPQIVAKGGNKNTLFNFLVDKVKKSEVFEIWLGTQKNILDIDDVYTIVSYILNTAQTINTT
ncbi:MAG: hypothetical protein JJW00_04445, partial [Sulfurimonas sp.]|nr:hypothetical protein [Sulfurimonas sp.]